MSTGFVPTRSRATRRLSALLVAVATCIASFQLDAGCPGCCSGHGGISDSCGSNGNVVCQDGTVSPSCTCASCGVVEGYTLSVQVIGSGTVRSTPVGIDCGTDCREDNLSGSLALAAVPDYGAKFQGWSGSCTGKDDLCTIQMTASKTVSATFSDSQLDFSACLDEFPYHTPPKLIKKFSQVRDLCFDSFAILHSGQSKTPLFVVERLNRARLIDAQDEERTDRFYEEARLPRRERSKLSDYAGSGYDRGHMAPAADMPNPNAMAQSFSLANMIPQAPENNRGIWAKRVEEATRNYVMRASGDVFVFTGPVFKKPVTTIGESPVWVPTILYKLVYDQETNRAWAFWIKNEDEARVGKPISYEELVKRVGIEFLPGIHPLP